MNNNLEFENEDTHPDSVEDNHPRTNYGNKPCTHEIVQEAMKIVSKDVISPKYVRNMSKELTINKVFEFYKEHLRDSDEEFEGDFLDKEEFNNAARDLISYHVSKALKIASEKACIKSTKDGFIEIDKQSIINAYPLDLIK